MPASPSPLNYFIGKGELSFTPSGGSPRDLGNAPDFTVTPNYEFLDHESSRTGVKERDYHALIKKSGTVEITLDEITPENLAMALFGEVTGSAFEIMSESSIEGALTLVGTNDIGSKYTVVVNSVSFSAKSGVKFIGDAFGTVELSGEMLAVAGVFGTVTETADATA